MKLLKSNLDEMQEHEILKMESVGFYILFWGTIISTVIQGGMGIGFVYLLDGMILVLIISIYFSIRSYKLGVYDRFLKPNMATNVVVSIIASTVVGFMDYGTVISLGGSREEAVKFGLISGIVILPIMFAVGTVGLMMYKKRRKKLDEEERPAKD